MSKPLIYIVDDNDGFRQSVAFMLDSSRYQIEQFNSAESALDKLENSQSRKTEVCMLLDVRMPGLSGLDLHDRLNQCQPDLPVIYMTGHADVPLAVEAMKKGAVTLLEKPLDPVALKNAVSDAIEKARKKTETAQAGQTADSSGSGIRPIEKSSKDAADFEKRLQLLTPREHDVLNFLVEGVTNKECAYTLNISVRTVEMHRSRILKKLEVRSGGDLIRTFLLHRSGT